MEHLTPQKLQEILTHIYCKGQRDGERISAIEMIEDIKELLITALHKQ
ncbi:hypothetical protein GCM10011391_06400 [Pullulanibacillus camelliae]|uniref:Uncharacterized protein n=1 Tax=Pullulanibacillus camelliae TaxID=1707096 RepID=A0A8J2VNC1_9BACL|nr:hypothetical protein [Pullulanibacillus camelliae]GGE30485.1 hypothetical protein GCM10011391_06400 [Pullulanibacillus camelliae]